MIIGNELPQFTDASGAFASRFILMTTDISFLGKEDPTLPHRLKAELPGILLWAIEGWKRLKARGRFLQPESSRASMRHFEFSSSPLTAFVEDCCVLDPEATIGKDVLYNAYTTWQQSEGRDFKMDKQAFATKLYAAFRGQVGETRPRKDGGRSSMFKGIRLKDDKELAEDDM
jgi:phage/plasmid-associated DNA primase